MSTQRAVVEGNSADAVVVLQRRHGAKAAAEGEKAAFDPAAFSSQRGSVPRQCRLQDKASHVCASTHC